MPNYFQRPENALKRANEFIDVGKKQPALDALYDVIKSKKHRTWQKIHEPIMEKYLDLCVELRKSHTAKEGLYQYKNICQQINVRSLEDVVRGYLRLAEQKTEEARKESEQSVLDIDDLDNLASPEDLLLSAVSGEDVQARTDRVVLIPWVKFLWESYRQCLDLLRNNNRVEKLYQDIAQDAFRFCQKYQRKTEFRKLCDNLRNHLGLIQKHQNQTTAINLNNPESQQMHLDTRLFQLDTAISMELWQEAYKAVEDIHSLMGISKKSPKPQMMANYYQKLGLVFWKSGNGLFHACALHRLLQLSREQRKNMPQEEIQRMASRVLLATLAIPIIPPRNDIGDMLDMGNTTMENQRKLANLLGLQAPSNRMQLVKDLVKYNVIPYAMPQVKDLYNWLEVEFHPLHLCERVTVVLDFLTETEEPELVQYVSALQNNTVMRLLKQVSQVYDSIQFSRLCALVPFTTPFHLERMVVDASRNGAVQVRVDHSTQALIYGSPLTVSQKDEQQEEGPRIQDMPADQIRNQLSSMSTVLHRAIRLIQPAHMKEERLNEKQLIIQSYRRTQRKEHERILQRRHIIEDRKEKLETISVQREKHEQDQIEQQQRTQREAEQQRLEREALERARKKQQEEIEEIQKKHAQERIKTLKQSAIGQKVFQKLKEEELSKMDADEIMAKHVEQLEAEKKELQARLKSQEKKVDHFARAMRVDEITLLKAEYEEKSVEDRNLWEQMEDERIAQLKAERQLAIKTRDRLSRMNKDKEEFINNLKQSRMNIYKASLTEYQDKLHEARTQRLMERKMRRKEERRAKWIEEKTEREQIRKDEEAKRLREEAKLKEETEYNEKMRKLEEQELKQAARMREVEERLAREKEGGRRGPRDEPRQYNSGENWRSGNDSRRGGDDDEWRHRDGQETQDKPRVEAWRPRITEGGWRDREKKREDSWRRSRDDPDNDAEATPEREEREKGALRKGEREEDKDIQREEEEPKKEDEKVIHREENEKPRDEVPQRREIRSSRFASRDIRLDEEGSNIQRPASRDIRLDEDQGPSQERDEWRKDGPRREYSDRGGRDYGDHGGRDFGDRGGRDFDDRGGRDFGDRGGRDFGDRGGRDFGDRGGRDFGERGRRDFGDRGGRDFDRGGRDLGDRGGRDFDRGGRDFGDRGGRDFDRGGRRDFGGRDRGEDSWRSDGQSRNRDGPPRDDWRRDGPPQGDREWRRDSPGDRGASRDDWGRRDGPKRDIDRDGGPRRDLGDRDRGPRRDYNDRDAGPRRDLGDRGGEPRRDVGDRDGGPRRDLSDRDRGSGPRPDGDTDNWRKDSAPNDSDVPPRDREPVDREAATRESPKGESSKEPKREDGWETVRRK